MRLDDATKQRYCSGVLIGNSLGEHALKTETYRAFLAKHDAYQLKTQR
jgi:hypothetical protein